MNVTPGRLDSLRGEKREETICSSGRSTSMNYDWIVIQNKVLIHFLLQQDEHLSTMSKRHTLDCGCKGKRGAST